MLDEPTDGMDPFGIEQALRLLVEQVGRHGRTVFFSSHQLPEGGSETTPRRIAWAHIRHDVAADDTVRTGFPVGLAGKPASGRRRRAPRRRGADEVQEPSFGTEDTDPDGFG